ncbi:MAG: hypothetical protein WDL87_00190 [Candidatus Omnitrophota bacterium]|jgi:hypothetical protein
MMGGMPGIEMSLANEAVLLVALALGYIVCYFANQEEKTMKQIGLAIGIFIIVLSFFLIANNLFLMSKMCPRNNDMMRNFQNDPMRFHSSQRMNMPSQGQQPPQQQQR